ncbi:MAG: hypothetical protein ACLFUY_10610 [Desulfobacterales bacterium]
MEKQKELVFITVIGQDRKGVVASISGAGDQPAQLILRRFSHD